MKRSVAWRWLPAVASILVATTVLIGCGMRSGEAPVQLTEAEEEAPAAEQAGTAELVPGEYADGVYFARAEDYAANSGWMSTVTLVVEDGRIVDAEWNAAHRNAGTDKLTRSRDGEYGMYGDGPAQWPWWEQASNTAAHLLETQDPADVSLDDGGYTDAFTGATIRVREFFTLAREALEAGPVGYGPWRDGSYSAQAQEFSRTGWKDTVALTVIAGRIVAVNWDGIAEDGGTNKKQRSRDGEYGMYGEGPAQWPWWEQVQAAERHLMDNQSLAAFEGGADAVSGASISLGGFVELVETALEPR